MVPSFFQYVAVAGQVHHHVVIGLALLCCAKFAQPVKQLHRRWALPQRFDVFVSIGLRQEVTAKEFYHSVDIFC